MLAAAPGTWVAIAVLFLLMGVVLSVIPFAGMLWSVVVPIHVGGLMLGCAALAEGRPLEIGHLFKGFEAPRLQPLALVGALYLAATIVVMIPVVLLMVGGAFASAFALGASGGSPGALAGVGVLGVAAVLLAAVAAFLLSLLIWFAPALVVFDDLPALDAMQLSFRGALANIGAFLVYTLVVLAAACAIVAPLVAAALLTAARGGDQSAPLAIAVIAATGIFAGVCILLLMPSVWATMYASYRDVFDA